MESSPSISEAPNGLLFDLQSDGGQAFFMGVVSTDSFTTATLTFDAAATGTFLYNLDDLYTVAVQDGDGDGAPNGSDNCPDVPNPGQADTNDDGIGDYCQCGDVNADGTVNNIDSILIKRAGLGLSVGDSFRTVCGRMP